MLKLVAIPVTLKTRLSFVNSKCRKPTKFQRVYIFTFFFFLQTTWIFFTFLKTALLNNFLWDLSVFHGQIINKS